jgi:hypothetical protein
MNKFQIILISAAFASSLGGQTLYLDTNGATSGAGFINPVSWDSAVWSTSSAGTAATGTWVAGSSAYFSAGPGGEVGTRILTLSTDVQISGISAYNENLQIDSAGGALTNSGNLSIIGSNSININADVNLGTNGLIYGGNNSLTLGGSNTFTTLTVSEGAVIVGQASAGALGTGRIAIGSGSVNFSSVDVSARVITGNVTREHVVSAHNYTGTVVSGANILEGRAGSNPERNGPFSAANIVLSHASAELRYITSGNVTIDAGTLQLPATTINTWIQTFGSITNNGGTIRLHNSNDFHTYKVTGDLTLNNGSFTAFDATLPTTGTSTIEFLLDGGSSSSIQVDGIAHLAGTLSVISSGYFDQYDGMTFNLITAASFVGSFDTVLLPTLTDGYAWDTSQLNTAGSISISAVPEPATFAALAGFCVLSLALYRRRHS